MSTNQDHLWHETPLIYSSVLSETLNALMLHPSYSFKYRGISHFVKTAKEKHGPTVHIVIASGGNAGLAAACAARALSVSCSVFIPQGASESTLNVLRKEKANVIVIGRHYPEALAAARDLVNREPEAVMVPAYDDPIVWEGHSSMVTEIYSQIERKPSAIFCSVGGGGLLGGILVGCERVGWDDVPVVALETIGSDCFYHSISLNGERFNASNKTLPPEMDLVHDIAHDVFLAHLQGFSSRASGSLGASSPAAGVVRMALERDGIVKSLSVPDELSMEALGFFAGRDFYKGFLVRQ
ncbi:tryptophan synthase beta subunit-like PLP-dependent enzyme [Cyathus striatus]|nr:tryptophan synthase beta subunit-like PLP-dependent enzyme [Cyathus striatus]